MITLINNIRVRIASWILGDIPFINNLKLKNKFHISHCYLYNTKVNFKKITDYVIKADYCIIKGIYGFKVGK
jgi:hypothetical protein